MDDILALDPSLVNDEKQGLNVLKLRVSLSLA
jgi:hypothetical protein